MKEAEEAVSFKSVKLKTRQRLWNAVLSAVFF